MPENSSALNYRITKGLFYFSVRSVFYEYDIRVVFCSLKKKKKNLIRLSMKECVLPSNQLIIENKKNLHSCLWPLSTELHIPTYVVC